MYIWLARTIFALIFTIFSFFTSAVESNIVVNTVNKPFLGGEHLLITENGNFGIAAGEGKLIVFNTQQNTLERIQELSLEDYTNSEITVASANFSPAEDLLFVVFKNYRSVDHHPALVFTFDNMTGNVEFLRHGPILSGKAVFSDTQNIIFDAVTYSDFDGTDDGSDPPTFDKGPQINAYQYSRDEDVLLWSQRYDIDNLNADIYFLADENYINSISFLAEEQYLTLTIANRTNEFFTRFLFKLTASLPELIGTYVPTGYVVGIYFENTLFFSESLNDNILALEVVGDGSQERDYHTVFFDVSTQNPIQITEIDGSCTFIPKRFNPQEYFSCKYDQSEEESVFMFDASYNLVEVTDQNEINAFEQLALKLDETFGYANAVTTDKALTLHRDEFSALSLFEIDENQAFQLLNRISEETLIDFEFNNAFSTPARDNQFITIFPESEHMIVKNTSTDIEPAYHPINLGRPSNRDSIGLLNENVVFRFNPYTFDQSEPLQFFRILEDGIEELAITEESAELLPEGYERYTSGQRGYTYPSHMIALSGDTLVFTALKSESSMSEYGIFSVQVSISANKVNLSEPELITTANGFEPIIWKIPTRRAFFINTFEENPIYEKATTTEPWQKIERERIASFDFISPDGVWLTNVRGSQVYLRNINWQEGWKIVDGDQAYFVPGGEWLLTYMYQTRSILFYKLINGEWTYQRELETNFPEGSLHSGMTEVLFANENYVYLVNRDNPTGRGQEVTFQILHWQFSSPTIIADEVTLDVDGSATLDLIQNDIETDNPIDIMSIELTDIPSELEVIVEGSEVTFTTKNAQAGVYHLQYRVADTYGNYAEPVAIKVEVNGPKVEEAPNSDTHSGSSGGTLYFWQLLMVFLLVPLRLLKLNN